MLSKRAKSLIQAHKQKKWGFLKGQGFWLGKKMSIETKCKISEARKGRVISLKTRKRISKALKGHIKSIEHRKKLSIALTGRKQTDEARRNMKLGHRKKGIFYYSWKSEIMERDGNKCQKCGNEDK